MAKKAFKSESKKLLDLMINSIYTNKDIFLRELISNGSDAIDKLYYESLTNKEVKVKKEDLEINITIDKDKRLLTISDNGCGMTKEELETNLGTIAKSGSIDIKEELNKKKDIDIIGQFGVGFYSAFMVSDNIKVVSKSYKDKDANMWESSGVDGYNITSCSKDDIGTTITLHIKDGDDYNNYLDQYEIKQLVKKYSDYIRYPIKMEVTNHKLVDEKEKKYEDVKEIETLNSMVPIWKKKSSEVSTEEYNNFYMSKFGDYEAPLKVISSSVEGMCSYKALLFIPSHTPYDYYDKNYEKGLALYSSGVLIMDKCSDLVPDYFSFIRGVVDSEDLPLNISREVLQKSANLSLIAKNIDTKIKKELEDMLNNERDKYVEFFKNFGVQLKYGIYNNFGADKDKLKDLVLFYSAKEKKLITLKEYVSSMKEEQKFIYYASGSNINKIDSMPQVDQVKDKDYDILYLTDYVDEFAITALQEYDSKKFKNVAALDLDFASEEDKKAVEKVNTDNSEMLKAMQEEIKDVNEVKFTNTLKNHPVCLTTKGDVSIEMQKVFDAMPNDMGIKADKILEINSNHPIAKKLEDLYKNDKDEFNKYTKILYSEALMIAGLPIDNPTEISNLISEVISK
jgi:molecular chaperone HtpG